MSFIGRAAVWAPAGTAENAVDGNRSGRASGPVAVRLTPLNVMTGSRIAASRNGVVRWVGADSWGEPIHGAARQSDQQRRSGRGWFGKFTRHTPRSSEPTRVCPRCGQAAHNDYGYAYERLVCLETTAA